MLLLHAALQTVALVCAAGLLGTLAGLFLARHWTRPGLGPRLDVPAAPGQSDRILLARAAEEKTLSLELYDHAVHKMASASLQATGSARETDPNRLRTTIDHMSRAVAEAQTDLRLLLGVWRSEAVDADPDAAIAALGTRLPPTVHASALEVDLLRAGLRPDITVTPAMDKLPMTVQSTVNRVLSVGVDHALGRAGGGHCVIRVQSQDDEVHMMVRHTDDDGGGADAPDHDLSDGLLRLRERLALTGGELGTVLHAGEWILIATVPCT